LTALGLLRILLLALQLHSKAIRQQLEPTLEVDPLGLLYEREDVAGGLTAKAVIDLLGGIDPKRGAALLVERA